VGAFSHVTTGNDRVSECAFFAGRVFYTGLFSSGLANNIYFSQIVEKVEQIGYCYQQNDPTSEIAFDLLPSDGGVIRLFEADSILKLVPYGSSLLVFATNGIWAISGSTGLGFTATDYSITKLTATTCLSASAFVDLEGTPVWWGVDGIYTIQRAGGDAGPQDIPQVTSLTDRSIRAFYEEQIPIRSRQNAKGAYDPITKHIRWLYRSSAASSPTEENFYDKVLSINMLTGSWTKWTLNVGTRKVHDFFALVGGGNPQVFLNVLDAALDTVIDGASDTVVVISAEAGAVEPAFKILTSHSNSNATFSEFSDTTNWLDWSTSGGDEDYTSSFVTAYRLDSGTPYHFQANYVFVFLEQETGASALMRARWDWTTSATTKRWSEEQQVYNSALLNKAVNYRRLKVRGKGRAIQLAFTSETGAPFTIVGWTLWETANASV
jgi:hypothetical protein